VERVLLPLVHHKALEGWQGVVPVGAQPPHIV
jgi:hypothetical protein